MLTVSTSFLNWLAVFGGGAGAPSAPVLSLNSAVAGLMTCLWDVDDTIGAGDTLTRQVATDSGFTSIIDTNAHVITAGEDSANQITTPQYQAPANGTYYIRGSVTKASTGGTSAWSNVLTVVVADMATSNLRIASTGNRRISSAGNFRKAS